MNHDGKHRGSRRRQQRNVLILCALIVFAAVIFGRNSRTVGTQDSSVSKLNVAKANITESAIQHSTSYTIPLSNVNDPSALIEKDATKRKILIKWFPESPLTTTYYKGQLPYYTDIVRAIENRSDDVEICNGNIAKCWDIAAKSRYQLTPIFPHGVISTMKLNKLQFQVNKLASKLKISFEEQSNLTQTWTPPIMVVFFVNKVYKTALKHKMNSLISPFRTDPTLRAKVKLLATTWSPHADIFAQEYQIPFVYIPFAVHLRMFRFAYTPWDSRPRHCDLFLRWDTNPTKYELREEISAYTFKDMNVYQPTGFLDASSYLQAIQDCKMTVSTIGMPGRFDLLGTRYYEVMASNTSLLLLQEPESPEAKYAYDIAGLVSGKTYVGFRAVAELDEKLHYYARHENEARAIVEEASQVAFQRQHSWSHRAQEVISAIRKHST